MPAMRAGKGRFGEAEPVNGKANSFLAWAHPDPGSVTLMSPTQPQPMCPHAATHLHCTTAFPWVEEESWAKESCGQHLILDEGLHHF